MISSVETDKALSDVNILSDAELDSVVGGAPLTWRQAVVADVRNLASDLFGWARSIFSF